MRLLLLLISFFVVNQTLKGQNGIYISSEGSINNENSVITVVDGDFVSTSSTVLNGGTIQMRGLDGNTHEIVLSNANTFDYLEFYGTSPISLNGQLTLNNELLFADTSSIILSTNSHITLAPTAEIVGESNINTITGADGTFIKTTRNHTAGVTNNFGLIGVEVSNGSIAMGSTEIYRRYDTFDIDGSPTVKRHYEINPTVNSSLDLDVSFYLLDVDLNGLQRSNLAAFRSIDNGTTFTNEGGTAGTFFHSVSNLNAFSLWAFADASTLNISNIDDLDHGIIIVPNPASLKVTIIPNTSITITSIELFNISGRKINVHLSDYLSFDVSNLSDGVYFLNIYSENSTVTKKLVIKK